MVSQSPFQAIPVRGMTELLIFSYKKIVNDIINIYQIHTKLDMGIHLYILCCLFVPNFTVIE